MKNKYFKTIELLIIFLLASQSIVLGQQKILLNDRLLGESSFGVDVFYRVISCDGGAPQVFMMPFNEHGKVSNVAFDVTFTDKADKAVQEIKVSFFGINPGDFYSPVCGDDKYVFLKYILKSQIDYNNMDVSIKF